MSASGPRAVAFDLDGLMFDTEPLYFEIERVMLGRRGKTMTRELAHDIMGRRETESLRILKERTRIEDSIETLLAERLRLYRELAADYLRPMPGLDALLSLLRARGVPCGIGTSARREFALHAVDRYGLAAYFRAIVTGDDVDHGKPHPEVYLRLAERLEVAPQCLLVLEDSRNGIGAARSAGALAVAIVREHSLGQSFADADEVYGALDDPALLKRMRL